MDCLVKTIVRRKVTQLTGSVSKAVSFHASRASASKQVSQETSKSTRWSKQIKKKLNNSAKRLVILMKRVNKNLQLFSNTRKHTSAVRGEIDGKVATRFDFV